jgi:hypothetical protein
MRVCPRPCNYADITVIVFACLKVCSLTLFCRTALLVLQLEEEAKTRYRDTEDQLAHKNLLIDGESAFAS